MLGDERVKIAGVAVVPEASSGPPGTLIAADEELLVACGRGAVRLARIQFPGRPWSTVAEQVRGRRLAPGMRFDATAGQG
jgi:methionyl-tRNA formyltransferase